jgi:hypothetical protein
VPISVLNRWSIPPVITSRDQLILGVDQPGPSNTGVLPGITRTVVPGNVTLSTPNQIYRDKTIQGRLSITAANVTVINCEIQANTTPASGVVGCTNAAVSNAVFEDCTIYTLNPHYTWGGVYGHDYTLRRCNVYGTTDILNIVNSSIPAANRPYQTGVVVEQCWLHDPVWWTAAAGGTVHPSDTETHNDMIQQFGGLGTSIRGCTIDARYARQKGHWFVTNPAVEPYSTVALHSLGDALNGPNQTIPDRGSGTEATGRYNTDDIAALMINATSGYSADFVFEDNWVIGGNYAVNGGGNPNPGGGVNLGSFKRNKFSRDQGTQGSGGNTTYTLAFLGGWAGAVDAPTTGPDANYYVDDRSLIQVRT